MIRTIIKKEVIGHFLTFKFLFSTFIAVLLIVLSTVLNVQNYREKHTNYKLALRDHRKELESFRV